MKFKIKTSTFKKWLDTVSYSTASITSAPILENILIKLRDEELILISNNLETAIEYRITSDISIFSKWEYCIPSKLIINYINLVLDENISVELIKEKIEISTSNWKIKIKWINAEEFPIIPKIKEETFINIQGRLIKNAIEKTLFSSSEWNGRAVLAGIFLNIKNNEITFASTDSLRLSEYKDIIQYSEDINYSQIIPNKTAYQIKNMLRDEDELRVVFWDSQIAFYFWNTRLFSRLLNGKFPEYSWFFPIKYSTRADINRLDLIQSLKKINLLSKQNNYSIKISFSKELWILIETNETEIWEGENILVWAIDGDDNIIWINSTYFLEVLQNIETSHISISFESPLSPILIKPIKEGKNLDNSIYRHIIMPLKI